MYKICLETYSFGVGWGDDSVGGEDEVQGEHGGARQTKGEEAGSTLCHQRVDHLLQEPPSPPPSLLYPTLLTTNHNNTKGGEVKGLSPPPLPSSTYGQVSYRYPMINNNFLILI